jgi:hypothetical protein
MRFEVTSDDHILSITDGLATQADERSSTFATAQELHQIGSEWPIKRLIAIWNGLPGVQAVQKFENRRIAIARIWRAIQPNTEQRSGENAMIPARARRSSRFVFREGSKAAEVCTLLRLRAAVILAGRELRKLNFGRQDSPLLKLLRRTLRDARQVARASASA